MLAYTVITEWVVKEEHIVVGYEEFTTTAPIGKFSIRVAVFSVGVVPSMVATEWLVRLQSLEVVIKGAEWR